MKSCDHWISMFKVQNGGVFPRPQTNWRERHGNFIDAVSSSKRVDYALKTGAPLPPPPKTAVPSGEFFNDHETYEKRRWKRRFQSI